MRVWLTRQKTSYNPSIDVWFREPHLVRYDHGDEEFVDSRGQYNPEYGICLRYFHRLTNVRLKPGECRLVDLRLSLKPMTPKRKKVKR